MWTMVQRGAISTRPRLVCQNGKVPTFQVRTGRQSYSCVVERGVLAHVAEHIPAKAGKVFVATTADVWSRYGEAFSAGLAGRDFRTLFFPGGESTKRFEHVEALAEQMV